MNANAEREETLRSFLAAAKKLADALHEYKDNLDSAPSSAKSELQAQWQVFALFLPIVHVMMASADAVFDEEWGAGVDYATSKMHLVIGMFGSWLGESSDSVLKMLGHAQALRPDVDMSHVRVMFE